MSSYDDFIKEKQVIDDLIQQDYGIRTIYGTLNGDVVEFEQLGKIGANKSICLTNPDSRKYVTTLLIKNRSE